MQYKHIGPRRGSYYRQYFVNGRGVRAQTLWLDTVGEDAKTPEQVADNYSVPVEAVREAIHYCEHNQALLRQEWEEEEADIRAKGYHRSPPTSNGQPTT
jgi:hypothetical protein